MKGLDVRNKLLESGYKLTEIAKTLNTSPQNVDSMLRTEDIKVGVLKKIAEAINKSLYFFFEDQEIKKDVPNDTPLNEIVNVLKDLAGSVKKIEISLTTLIGDKPSTPSQSHTQYTLSNEHTADPLNDEAREKMLLAEREAKTIAKRKRENLQGDSQDQA